jgi:hypothetical protein
MYVFFENDLFDPGIGYFSPQISLKKCFFRLSTREHSGPFSQSTVIHWAETAKNG